MTALAIIPFLEGLGMTSVFGGAAAEVIGTGAASEFIGGAATGIIGSKIADKVDQGIARLYTDNIPADIQANITKALNRTYAGIQSYSTQDPKFLIVENLRQKEQERLAAEAASTPVAEVAQNTQRQPDPLEGLVVDANAVSDNLDDIEEDLAVSDDINIPPRNISDVDFLNRGVNYAREYEDSVYDPRAIARLVIDISRELAETRDIVTATRNVLELDPSRQGLIAKVTQYLASKSIPNSEEYLRIAKIFDGRNIQYSNFSKRLNPSTGLIEVSGIDELGNKVTLPQTTGLILPGVSADLVFMGPASRNDDLPNPNRVEDWYSFFHDYDYQSAYFSRIGDLKFISRLSTALKDGRVLPENVNLVQNTILYFTNVSLTIGMLKGEQKLSGSDIAQIIRGSDNIPDAANDVPAGIFADLDVEQSPSLESQYYGEMMDELNTYSLSDGLFVTSANRQIDRILQEISVEL